MEQSDIIKGLEVICKCKAVKHKTIKNAIINGANTIEKIRQQTRANTGCGKMCTQKILDMIEKYTQMYK